MMRNTGSMKTPTRKRAPAQENSVYCLTDVSFVQKHCRMLRAPPLQNISSSFEMVPLFTGPSMSSFWVSCSIANNQLWLVSRCILNTLKATSAVSLRNQLSHVQCLTSTKIFLLIVRHSGKLCKVKGEIKIAFYLKFKLTELPLPF